MIMANFTRVLTFPFDLASGRGSSTSNSNGGNTRDTSVSSTAMVKSPSIYTKSSKFIKAIILRPSTLSNNIGKKQHHEVETKTKIKPQIQKKHSLQTKDVKRITRQDLINGTYDHLNTGSAIRRSASTPHEIRSHRSHSHSHSHRRHSHRSRSKGSSPSSTKSPLSTPTFQSPRPTIEISGIDADRNEMFIPAQEQIRKTRPKTMEKASNPHFLLSPSNTHRDDGMLTITVHRSITAESDVSDYVSI